VGGGKRDVIAELLLGEGSEDGKRIGAGHADTILGRR
jgi:hypothetical protein